MCPKQDTFNESVAYLLIIITPVEISLLAIVRDDPIVVNNRFKLLSIQPTKYNTPSDNLTFLSVACTNNGRIFLAGNDCCIYEFFYENEESSWMHYLGIGADFTCKKRKISSEGPFQAFYSFFGGDSDSIVNLTVDDTQQLLYVVTKLGKLSIFYLPKNSNSQVLFVSNSNLIENAKSWTQGRSNPKPSDLKKDDYVFDMFTITTEESNQANAVVVLSSGLRIYLQVKSKSQPFSNLNNPSGSIPNDFSVVYVRNPPRTEDIEKLKTKNEYGDVTFPPAMPSSSTAPLRKVCKALYSKGSFFTAIGKEPGKQMLIHSKLEHTFSKTGEIELRENLCAMRLEDDTLFFEKVEEIKEINLNLYDLNSSTIQRLWFASKTPDTLDGSNSSKDTQFNDVNFLEPVPGPGKALPYLGRPLGAGYSHQDMTCLNKQIELASQMIPTLYYTQRKFLCLTNKGIHLIAERRPIDYLFALLANTTSIDERSHLNILKSR